MEELKLLNFLFQITWMELNINGVKRYKCLYCEKSYGKTSHTAQHFKQKHLGLRLACPFCTYTSPRQYDINRHIKRMHKDTMALLQ